MTLGEQLDDKVQNHVQALRNAGTPTGSSVVMAAGEGMIMAHDGTLLVQHGGHIEITKSWAMSKKFKERVENVVVLDCSPGPEQTTNTTVVDPHPTSDQTSSDQKHHLQHTVDWEIFAGKIFRR